MSRAAAFRGRNPRGRGVSGLLLATAIPTVDGGGSAEDPAEERPEAVTVGEIGTESRYLQFVSKEL